MTTSDRQATEGSPRKPTARAGQSRSWFPGRYVPVRVVQGLEVFPPQRRGCVQVSRTTLHGTAAELRALAWQMLRAADVLEDRPRAG
jgi:hypothetical protein